MKNAHHYFQGPKVTSLNGLFYRTYNVKCKNIQLTTKLKQERAENIFFIRACCCNSSWRATTHIQLLQFDLVILIPQ